MADDIDAYEEIDEALTHINNILESSACDGLYNEWALRQARQSLVLELWALER